MNAFGTSATAILIAVTMLMATRSSDAQVAWYESGAGHGHVHGHSHAQGNMMVIPAYDQCGYPGQGYGPPMQGLPVQGHPHFHSPPMNQSAQWSQQGYYEQHQSGGVEFERPGLAVVGGILAGVGGSLQAAEPEQNKAAGGILMGIGQGMFMGSQPGVYQNQGGFYGQQGSFGHTGW